MTINEYIEENPKILPQSARVNVVRAYKKAGLVFPKGMDNDMLLPEAVIEALKSGRAKVVNGHEVLSKPKTESAQGEIKPYNELSENPEPTTAKKKRTLYEPKNHAKTSFIRRFLPYLPLPMLGLAASFGVYFFALRFVPQWVAIGEAMAFELTYIGLAVNQAIAGETYKRARWVSLAAVGVSVIFNTISAALHMHPDLMDILKPTQNGIGWGVCFWIICVLHGAPLAILGFFISELGFVKKD